MNEPKHYPLIGCVLIGGNSTRMGRPKHLIERDGETWLEHSVDLLSVVTDNVVVVGNGDVPEIDIEQISDVDNCPGPLAGILAVFRKYPQSALLICACDMPDLSLDALRWLLSKRSFDAWAVLPKTDDHYEPLLAWYDSKMAVFFEKMFSERIFKLSKIASAQNVNIVKPPFELQKAWRNVNLPEQII